MQKIPDYLRIVILMGILCIPPIGATQIGWFFWGKEVGINCGMVVGTISVTVAAYLMCQKGWRDSDDGY